MRIITWNCNMAFRKKAKFILALQPDIVVVPECEHPDKLQFDTGTKQPTAVFWQGTNLNKGIGIFSYSGYRFKLHKSHNPAFRHVLPLVVTGGNINFILFAVWAHNPDDKDGQYITQVWKAIHYYDKLLSGKNIILAGDFNSNTIWDRPKRAGNHSAVVKKLAAKKIFSTYHIFHQQEQGKEKHPTWYMYRHRDKPYHLDYCFASAYFMERLTGVEVGTYRKWAAHSDHKPVIVTFDSQV
jgi:exodeoxyribonuclease III